MNRLAAVVKIEKEQRSNGMPGRHVSQMPATLIIALLCRWILKGRFRSPSVFHSKKPVLTKNPVNSCIGTGESKRTPRDPVQPPTLAKILGSLVSIRFVVSETETSIPTVSEN